MYRTVPVVNASDILPAYRGTPIDRLLRYHNCGEAWPETGGRAQLLVGMCMDDRKDLTVPNEFAYVIRAAGGNLRDHEFDISYAIAVGGVTTIAILGHTDCGMVNVRKKRGAFIGGLVERGGWSEDAAARHFDEAVKAYEIDDALKFTIAEAARLRELYPGVLVAPLMYRVEDDRLVQVEEG